MLSRKVKNSIRKILCLPVYKTRTEINAVPVVDCKEELVPIIETQKLKINKDPHTPLRKSSFSAMTDHKVRTSVYERLVQASEKLPEGYSLSVFESFRPYSVQLERFNFKVTKLKELFPDIDEQEIERRARLGIADPRNGGGPHQTGGAVDVTILSQNGTPLDMGTDWAEFNAKTPTKNWHKIMFQKDGLKIMRNRKMLVRAMESAGFVNYPGEWWHYSYGDKTWAVLNNKENAIYGSFEEQFLLTSKTIDSTGVEWLVEYADADKFDNLPQDRIKQSYGVCFDEQGKMIIGFGGMKKGWGLIGGSLEEGETPEQALYREIQEESNTEVVSYLPIGYQKVTNLLSGKIIFQLRYVCKVKVLGNFEIDSGDGMSEKGITEIKFIEPSEYKNYFDWGEIGEHIIKRAVELKNKL